MQPVDNQHSFDDLASILAQEITNLQIERTEQKEQQKQAKIDDQYRTNVLRKKTFEMFDFLSLTFEKIISQLKAKNENCKKNCFFFKDSKKTQEFSLRYGTLYLYVEIKNHGKIFLTFGIPEKQPHALYNWTLRGLFHEEQHIVKWYLFNMKDQVSPDFLITNPSEVVQFFLKEMLVNQEQYLTRPHSL